jgi:asparagine synthase (glutamine-hydrolysing)
VLHHRGPDAGATFEVEAAGLGLGHRRLAILDLDARSNQPMRCARTGNIVVFNGEIYNFRALRGELQRAGAEFTTTSDTEVVLAAYAAWGARCVDRFNGMFALALFDAQRNGVFFARDRVGKKPLYISTWGGELTFASELKALLAARPALPRDLDPEALRAYFDLGYIPGALSIYRAVRKLRPAHRGWYDLAARTYSEDRYWALPSAASAPRTEADAADELEALLDDAVRLRLESDVPVGAFLSGGLDSSLVVALAARHAPGLVTYTARFGNAAFDESSMAARVAEWLGLPNVALDVDPPDASAMAQLGRQFDEPFADSSLIPTYLVSRAIARHTKVALSGDGGDELFAGYDSYRRVLHHARRARVPRPVRRAAALLHHAIPVGVPGRNFLRHLPYAGVEFFRRIGADPESVTASPLRAEVDAAMAALPRDGFRGEVLDRLRGTHGDADALRLMTELDFETYLPDDVLVKVDRASMLASLEVRSPLLDYRIAEFAFRLPADLKVRGGRQKHLLKVVAQRHLPPEFPIDRKQGFAIPAADWFRSEWGAALMDLVPDDDPVLDRTNVARILARHRRNGREAPLLFRALMLAHFGAAARAGARAGDDVSRGAPAVATAR